jgi:hypothetical protein
MNVTVVCYRDGKAHEWQGELDCIPRIDDLIHTSEVSSARVTLVSWELYDDVPNSVRVMTL